MKSMSVNAPQRFVKHFVFAALMLGLSACSSFNFPFNPIDKNRTYKPSSIAVISGDEQDIHMKLAEFITKGLTERSTFRVMSQKEIEKRIPDYPPSIKFRTDLKEDDEKPIWVGPSAMAKLNAIQSKLQVDYLFVVWNRNVGRSTVRNYNGGGSTTDYVYPAGNLIEYPGAKVVASTISVAGSDQSILALFRDADYYIMDALKVASEDIVDEFLAVTKSKKH